MAYFYSKPRLLSVTHERVGRTLLSADFGVGFGEININGKVNGGGQECPPYTCFPNLGKFLSIWRIYTIGLKWMRMRQI
jgi:hypothetical protein